MKAMTTDEINNRLLVFDGWEYQDGCIYTAFEFENFKECFSAMTRIAFEAERLNHHPDWANVYNQLEIFLSTHDADGVTEKDFELAEIIEELIG